MVKLNKNKVSGSSLIEVIISLVILMTVSGIGLIILLNLMEHNNPAIKMRAFFFAEEILADYKKTNTYQEMVIEKENFVFEIISNEHTISPLSKIITVNCIFDEKELFEIKELITVENE